MGDGGKVNNQGKKKKEKTKPEEDVIWVVKNQSCEVADRSLIKSGKDLPVVKYMILPVFTKNEPKNRYMAAKPTFHLA